MHKKSGGKRNSMAGTKKQPKQTVTTGVVHQTRRPTPKGNGKPRGMKY